MYSGGLKELLHTNHSCWLLKHAALLNIPSVYLMHSILIKRVYYVHIIFEQNLPRAQLLGKYFLFTFIKAFNGLFARTLILMNIRLKKNSFINFWCEPAYVATDTVETYDLTTLSPTWVTTTPIYGSRGFTLNNIFYVTARRRGKQ